MTSTNNGLSPHAEMKTGDIKGLNEHQNIMSHSITKPIFCRFQN